MSSWSWPSKDKVSELRREGQVPYSSFATRCVLLAAGILLLSFSIEQLISFKESSKTFLSDGALFHSAISAKAFWEVSIELFIGSTLFFLAIILCTGLLQNKFLFNFGLIKLKFGRDTMSIGELIARTAGWAVFSCIVVGACAYLVFHFLALSYPFVVAFYTLLDSSFDDMKPAMFTGAAFLVAVGFILLAVLWWLAQWVAFLWKHRTIEE